MTASPSILAQEIVGSMATSRRPLVGRLVIAQRGLRGINPHDLPEDLRERLVALLIVGDSGVSGDARAALEAMDRSQLGPLAGRTVRLLLAIMGRDSMALGSLATCNLTQARQAALAAAIRERDGVSPG